MRKKSKGDAANLTLAQLVNNFDYVPEEILQKHQLQDLVKQLRGLCRLPKAQKRT